MAKPYVHWRPRDNAALHVRASEGPLEVTAADLDTLRLMVAPWVAPSHFPFDGLGYLGTMEFDAGVAPLEGVHITAFPWLVNLLEFWTVNPIDGSPLPDDLSDLYSGVSLPLLAFGYCQVLRGWLGHNDENHFNSSLEVEWADRDARPNGARRGAWTGCALNVTSITARRSDWLLYSVHGKRPLDISWSAVGGHIESPWSPASNPKAALLEDGIATASMRVTLSGGPPLWTALEQIDVGAGFVDVHSDTIDVAAHSIAHPERLGIIGALIAAPATPFPAVPATDWPFDETWFRRIKVAQFEPWVLDVADWKIREWEEHHAEFATPPTDARLRELRMPPRDLVHTPAGHPNTPPVLRETDEELGICIRLGKDTVLGAATQPDWPMIHVPLVAYPMTPFGIYGPAAPFAAKFLVRTRDMSTWATTRTLFTIGDPFAAAPGPGLGNNGLGLFWRPASGGELVARCCDGAAWAEAVFAFTPADYDGEIVDIAMAWTGAKGILAGRPDYELRLVVNGITVAAIVLTTPLLDEPGSIMVGGTASEECFECLLVDACLIAEASPDLELLRAHEWEHTPFENDSFEDAAESGRAGEADAWTWASVQQVGGFADFNTYDAAFERWREGRELFDAAWGFDPAVTGTCDEWASDLIAAIAAIFNALASVYRGTIEQFILWNGPPWVDEPTWLSPPQETPPLGWTGWIDEVFGFHYAPLDIEGFEEAWDNDLLGGTGEPWASDTAHDGVLRGAALTFPLSVPPDHSHLTIVHNFIARRMSLVAGVYDDVATLAAMLQAAWVVAAGPATGLCWSSWTSGVTFGWDGSTAISTMAVFGATERAWFSDARALLGLNGIGFGGQQGRIELPAALLWSPLPAGIIATDTLLLDPWTQIELSTDVDLNVGGIFALTYGMVGATFDTAIFDPTYRENWVGSWDTVFTPFAQALFDGGVSPQELFTDALWPDWVWL